MSHPERFRPPAVALPGRGLRPALAPALALALGVTLVACTESRPQDERLPAPGLAPRVSDAAAPSPAIARGRTVTAESDVRLTDIAEADAKAPAGNAGARAATPPAGAPAMADAMREESRATRSALVRAAAVPAVEKGWQTRPWPEPAPAPSASRERYAAFADNPTRRTAEDPVSTFSIDVDTGSYANVRRILAGGALPPPDAVRIEELINYFDYGYPLPAGEAPFSITTELGPTPWNASTRLLHVGLQGARPATRPPANLVFLVDVSGSMASPDKLGLLKTALRLLARELGPEDRVGIVTYAGAAGVALESVPGDARGEIERALLALEAGGSTHGEAGIESAYRLADESYVDGGINRVILATDGDFNVGTSDVAALERLVAKRRASGIALSTLGFGTGNYNDHLMERLADVGDGNHAYIDTPSEARKVLVDELASTLHTIARDVKVQIEFNPAVVAEYRLLGYVNRALADEDFADDRVDAGEIGAGHSVTALYEIALHGEGGERHVRSRYGRALPEDRSGGEIAELRLRHKRPGGTRSRLLDSVIRRADARAALDATSDDFRFAAAVAAFGQRLRGDTRVAGLDYEAIARLARDARGDDRFGYRSDFARLVELAASLAPLDDALTRRGSREDGGQDRGERDDGAG